MKKILSFHRLFISMITLLCSTFAMAYDFYVDGIYYNKTSDMTVEVTSGENEYDGNIVIPSVIMDEYFVTGINSDAFKNTNITSITIPSKIQIIGAGAFYRCYKLRKVIVKDLESWCKISFEDKEANPLSMSHHLYKDVNNEITDLVIPAGTIIINDYAFYDCDGLTSVTIPEGVASIGNSAFNNCSGLTSATIPSSVNSIGDYAYCGCKKIENVYISEGVEKIGIQSFVSCTNLKTVSIPSTIKIISNDAFSGCKLLEKTSISDITSWCQILFSNKDSNPLYYSKRLYINNQEIKNLVIPEGIYQVNDLTFYGWEGLVSVSLPSSLTSISGSAFRYSGLSCITIPSSTTNIGEAPFRGCHNLTSIIVESGNTIYDSRNNCNAIIKTASNSLIQGCKNTIIPNSVTQLDRYSFAECKGLSTIDIPNGVTFINVGAISSCPDLEKITIPQSVSSIYTSAFFGNPKLVNITSYMANPPTDNNNFWHWFDTNTYALATLYVPKGYKSIYESTTGWNKFVNIEEFDIPSGIADAFEDNSVIKEYYDIRGQRITAPQPGFNIIRMSDGMTRKIVVK